MLSPDAARIAWQARCDADDAMLSSDPVAADVYWGRCADGLAELDYDECQATVDSWPEPIRDAYIAWLKATIAHFELAFNKP